MKIVDLPHPEHQVVFTATDPNIKDAPARLVPYSDGSSAVITAWKPSFKERLQLLLGRHIFVAVMGTGLPPISLTLDAEEIGLNQDISSKEAHELLQVNRRTVPNGNFNY